jgi:hypothetical protein
MDKPIFMPEENEFIYSNKLLKEKGFGFNG